MTIARRAAAALLVAGLIAFYYAAASEHCRVVNTSKARGDQSAHGALARFASRSSTFT